MEYLPKALQDALLIIHYSIDRPVTKAEIDTLIERNLIVAKHPKGWMTTSLGREFIRRLK